MGYTDCKRISAVPGLKAAWAGQNGGEDYEYCMSGFVRGIGAGNMDCFC